LQGIAGKKKRAIAVYFLINREEQEKARGFMEMLPEYIPLGCSFLVTI